MTGKILSTRRRRLDYTTQKHAARSCLGTRDEFGTGIAATPYGTMHPSWITFYTIEIPDREVASTTEIEKTLFRKILRSEYYKN